MYHHEPNRRAINFRCAARPRGPADLAMLWRNAPQVFDFFELPAMRDHPNPRYVARSWPVLLFARSLLARTLLLSSHRAVLQSALLTFVAGLHCSRMGWVVCSQG